MDLGRIGLILVLAGFSVAVIGVVAVAVYAALRGVSEVGYGGCVLIMFVPICFGTGSPNIAPHLLIASAILMLAVVVVAYLLLRFTRSLASGTYHT